MLKSKFIKALSLTGTILFSQSTWATPPSDELLAKYNQVYRTNEQIRNMIIHTFKKEMYLKISNMIDSNPDYVRAVETSHYKQLGIIIDKSTEQIADLILADGSISQGIIKAQNSSLREYYTSEEIQALIDFASTPLGQSITKKQSVHMFEIYENSSLAVNVGLGKVYTQVSSEYEQILAHTFKQIEDILQQAKKDAPKVPPAPKALPRPKK